MRRWLGPVAPMSGVLDLVVCTRLHPPNRAGNENREQEDESDELPLQDEWMHAAVGLSPKGETGLDQCSAQIHAHEDFA